MASIHVLTIADGRATIVMHIAIPGGNNSAGVAWSTALIRSGLGGTARLLDGDGTGGTISAAEKSAIQAGTLYEVAETVIPDSASSNAERNAYLDALFTAAGNRALSDLQARLKYFGATRG